VVDSGDAAVLVLFARLRAIKRANSPARTKTNSPTITPPTMGPMSDVCDDDDLEAAPEVEDDATWVVVDDISVDVEFRRVE